MLFLASNGGRQGTTCVAKVVMVSAALPLMGNTASSPGGLPIEMFDGIRAASIADCWQLCKEFARGH